MDYAALPAWTANHAFILAKPGDLGRFSVEFCISLLVTGFGYWCWLLGNDGVLVSYGFLSWNSLFADVLFELCCNCVFVFTFQSVSFCLSIMYLWCGVAVWDSETLHYCFKPTEQKLTLDSFLGIITACFVVLLFDYEGCRSCHSIVLVAYHWFQEIRILAIVCLSSHFNLSVPASPLCPCEVAVWERHFIIASYQQKSDKSPSFGLLVWESHPIFEYFLTFLCLTQHPFSCLCRDDHITTLDLIYVIIVSNACRFWNCDWRWR